MDFSLFDVIWEGLSPFIYDILRIVLAFTLVSNCLKLMRAKTSGVSRDGNNYFQVITNVFIGYLLGKSIPLTIRIIDSIVYKVLLSMKDKIH